MNLHDLVSKVEINVIDLLEIFCNCVFGKNNQLGKYKLYENVLLWVSKNLEK